MSSWPAPPGVKTDGNALTPGVVRSLPATTPELIANAYSKALTLAFFHLAPLLGLAAVLLVSITEKPLPPRSISRHLT